MSTRLTVPLLTAVMAASSALALPAAAQQPLPPPMYQTVPVENARDFHELERLAMAEVPYIKKMEVRDMLLKVDGFDAQGMKVKIYMDRRTGSVLSREVKYDKHGPFGKHGWRYFQNQGAHYPVQQMPRQAPQQAPQQGPGGTPPARFP